MFTLFDSGLARDCQGFSRREFFKVGALSFGGLTLSNLLAARALAAAAGKPVKDRSVVLLFHQGGPPHIEFFDPKMTAPVETRSINGELKTSLPGVTFGGTFPKLARLAHKLAVVRSYASGNGGHTYQAVASGGNPTRAAMGALYARVAGTNHPVSGMPRNVLILPEAIDPTIKLGKNFETGALPTLTTPGDLGPSYAAFDPSGGGQLKQNLELKLPRERFDDRRALLKQLDTFKRQVEKTKALDGVDVFQQQAYEVITRGIANAFDLSKEDAKTVARYDTSHLFKLEDITKWFDMRRASNLLGKQLLLARRLCEAGCGFVTVSDCGWDYHANGNSPKNMGGLPSMGGQVDHAVAAFIEDLEARGLSDRILLVITGEMGRTPRLNKNGGRDHWADLTTLAFAGGGLKMGQVIGQSDSKAARPATEKYTPANLLATVMNHLLDVGEVRLMPDLPRDVVKATTEGKPIPGLLA
ncbi:MAG TPA: DUF1501 domain-containing protein [Gemmataceae bacterium]|nr:DUF1501 domain-containing protein [Gemmataceae bacterium]